MDSPSPYHPGSDRGSDSIEMTNLDEVVVTPDLRHQSGSKHAPYSPGQHDSDEEDEGEDGGNRALLGSRGRELSPEGHTSRWAEVKSIVIQAFPTLLVTTCGLLLTGEILSNVSHWKAMSRVDELIMIIPVVLNLKGNLEMNLSARLSTAANVGELDTPDIRRAIITGNLTLLQVQATVVSFVAACVAFLLGRVIPRPSGDEAGPSAPGNSTSSVVGEVTGQMARHFISRTDLVARRPRPIFPGGVATSGPAEFVMVASAAMTSTCIASAVLGSFVCLLIVLCRRFRLDPDNIAPPVASCLGDLVTLSILGVVSALHLAIIDTPLPFCIVVLLIIAAIGWTIVTRRNGHVKHLLMEGWAPLFAAMVISSGTGLVLDAFVSRYEGYALLSVVTTGLPGGVGSIFVSRLSTYLHAAAMPVLTSNDDFSHAKSQPKPWSVAMTLLLIALPIEVSFLAVVHGFGWLRLDFAFMVLQVLFFCMTVR
ncbi:hypothetical protein AcV7_009402 [Taiwanofungus camphoratus]|nr:hypothetical protein AcV7_009402 [Antrodia cinnamomea]